MSRMNRSGFYSPLLLSLVSSRGADSRTIVDGPLKEFIPHGGQGPIQRLREGNFDVDRIKCVMLSHQHFDRKATSNPSSLESS